MIYIEYMSRRSGTELREFDDVMSKSLHGWDAGYQADDLVLGISRTWRMGPEPEHIAVWYSHNIGFERIDEWERIFRSGEADHLEEPLQKVARIEAAGCYEPLLEPVHGRNGTYFAEFFRAAGEHSAIRRFYQERIERHERFTLNLLVHRIGRLGPAPGGLAVWTIPDFAALSSIVKELDGVCEPIQLETAGTYTDVGKEII